MSWELNHANKYIQTGENTSENPSGSKNAMHGSREMKEMERGECAFFVIRFYFRYDNESMWLSDLEVKDMPVPSSYNDISTEATLRGDFWFLITLID